MRPPIDPTTLPQWSTLERLAQSVPRIGELVGQRSLVARDQTLLFDYTRQRVNEGILRTLFELSDAVGLPDLREAMFTGQVVNTTEARKVLHTALRGTSDDAAANESARAEFDRMAEFADGVRTGEITGITGKPFRTVVNIGIGGSDLGPRMVYEALTPFVSQGIQVRFVSNIDSAAYEEAFAGLDPESTLVLVASKTFTTAETMSNARLARDWLVAALGEPAIAQHMVAISTASERVRAFGIGREFGFWEWIGGRYSVGSSIGLSLMIAIGAQQFRAFLDGFARIDRNFRHAPDHENLALIMGLLAVWNRNFLGIQSLAVLPYAHRLRSFPQYLQQLIMESNGKSVRRDGRRVEYETSPIVWGEAGTDGQHSFHQLIHQGTSPIACDIIIVNQGGFPDQQRALIANALAQAEVFALGHDAPGETARMIGGNQPTSVIITQALSPEAVGSLIALYEHSVFVQGAVWGINPFDQFGVELGKTVARDIEKAMASGEMGSISALTRGTLAEMNRVDDA